MNKVNWDEAPKDAEICIDGRFIKRDDGEGFSWERACELAGINWSLDTYMRKGYSIEFRPKSGELDISPEIKRQNEQSSGMKKQERYINADDGLDHIDEFARDNSIEDFRAAMRFTIGKYEKRLGKKDARSLELYKIADYYNRWSQIERAIELDREIKKGVSVEVSEGLRTSSLHSAYFTSKT
jgi:hypothetical protein